MNQTAPCYVTITTAITTTAVNIIKYKHMLQQSY